MTDGEMGISDAIKGREEDLRDAIHPRAYLDRGKFELCYAAEFRAPEARRMEQGATRSGGHVP